MLKINISLDQKAHFLNDGIGKELRNESYIELAMEIAGKIEVAVANTLLQPIAEGVS